MKGYNAVQYDRQWIRRVMREEKTLIDAFTGKPSNKIDDIYDQYGSQFYPQGPPNNYYNDSASNRSKSQVNGGGQYSKQSQRSKAQQNLQEEAKKHYQDNEYDDDLDNISKISVQTPKTQVSIKSKQSQAQQSVASRKTGMSVGRSSVKTTTTTRDQLAALKVELDREKQLRYKAELEIKKIKKVKQ